MSYLLEIIKGRRSVRTFTDMQVPEDMLNKLLEGAIWAPSGSNIQPWVFCVVRDLKKIRNIASFSPGLNGKPPLLLVLCVNEERAFEKGGTFGRDELAIIDVSLAAQNIMLLAHELGLGTCAVKSFNVQGVAKILRLPGHIKPVLIITAGFPARPPAAGRRRPFSEVVFYDEWEAQDDGKL